MSFDIFYRIFGRTVFGRKVGTRQKGTAIEDEASYEIEGLEVVYSNGLENLVALSDVNLKLPAQELISIIGDNGSGKSTLLLVLAGIVKPQKGKVSLWINSDKCDFPFEKEDRMKKLRDGFISVIFQDLQLIPHLTPLENVALPLFLRGVEEKEAMAIARSCLAELKIGYLAERKSLNISGGEKQLIAIARALTTSPKVILADEPTSELHIDNCHKVLSAFRALIEKRKITVVMVTHQHDLVQKYCRHFLLAQKTVNGNIVTMLNDKEGEGDDQDTQAEYSI